MMSRRGRETGYVERAQRTRVNVRWRARGRHASAYARACVRACVPLCVRRPVDSEVSDGSSS